MTPDSPLIIEVPDAFERIPVGATVPLRLVISRPSTRPGPVVIPYVSHRETKRVLLNADLLQQEVTLHPGECLELTVGVAFLSEGPANLSDFYVQADPPNGGDGTLVRLPDRPLRIVPSMASEVEARVERICAYDQGVKVEVVLRHASWPAWEDFGVEVGPAGQVRAGIVRHRRPRLESGQVERFEVVTAAGQVELSLAGTRGGERVEDRRTFLVPQEAENSAAHGPFSFLEPRAITSDRITIQAVEGGAGVVARKGVYHVTGDGQSYLVTIYPNDPSAKAVRLLKVAGKVEVEPRKSEGGAWSFLVTAIESPLMAKLARLDYDVETPRRFLGGELYLAVQPTNRKLWMVATTAGVALSIRGLTGVLPAMWKPDILAEDLLPGIFELLRKHWTDWLQLFSIPILWVTLRTLGWGARLFRGW